MARKLAYTGLRRGDAVRLGCQRVRDGVATLPTEKSQGEITLPILPVTLAAGPCGDLNFIAGARGQPLTKESFGDEFREASRAAGVPGSTWAFGKLRRPGRRTRARRLRSSKLFSDGRAAEWHRSTQGPPDLKRLALEAMSKLADEERKSIPSPRGQVRAAKRKS